MSTSLLPILSMLTSGTLGDMLSPSKSIEEKQKNTWRDTNDLIAWNCVVYVGLDSLSDPMVGSAIGALFLSDLACVAGARYNVSSPLVPPRFDAMTENGNSSSGVSHEQILHLASGIQRLP